MQKHVVPVSDAHDCTCGHLHDDEAGTEPDCAYTVGLWHQRQHPDLLISGLPPERGEDWTSACGKEHDDGGLVVWHLHLHLHHTLTRCPALYDVADLLLEHWAERPDAVSPWTVARSDPE